MDSTIISGRTKDYILTNGHFDHANSLVTEIYSVINCPLGSYPFNNNFGSNFPLWINSRKKVTRDDIHVELIRILGPYISRGRILSFSYDIKFITLGVFQFELSVTDADNKVWQLPVNM